MAWQHLDITKPHLVYIILGGFTSLFMLCSSFIKERMYIGEATVATLCGVIFGPHAANLINPNDWGSVDIVTVEFSRIVLVVQCFAVGVELPKYYMERHWKSVIFLLLPVMTAGWLLTSLFIWWMVPVLSWLESLVVAACVTATDPVLASSVVGKGKFAKRVPKHLRDLLSAESGCNDGMAFPFIYLSLYLIQYHRDAAQVSFHFIVYVILYECIFGAVYGFCIGYIARHGIRMAEKYDLIDRESFLVFYFVVALFCAGSGSILGVDDLLVGFAAGVGFSNDGWFGEKTEESHVSNVIDLLINLAYFVYFGTIIPWEQYNSGLFGLYAWRLVVIAIFVLLFRRIPIMLALKPFIPDVRNWREALFAGHFGPIGVGAIFVAILARAELEHEEPVPLSQLPDPGVENYALIYLVWPIVTFLVISSILIHGSSIAVFTLGKRINTLSLTMSYTAAPEDGPSWMNRLPRISSQSRSQAKTMSEASFDLKDPQYPAGTLAPPGGFLRRQRDEDHSRPGSRTSSLVSRKRKHKKWDDGIGPGGPVSQSAIFPNRQSMSPTDEQANTSQPTTDSTLTDNDKEKSETLHDQRHHEDDESPASPQRVNIYEEGHHLVFEDQQGEVIDTVDVDAVPSPDNESPGEPSSPARPGEEISWSFGGLRRRFNDMYTQEVEKRKEKSKQARSHEPAHAYQFGNQIIVEDKDGEVVKTYQLPSSKSSQESSAVLGSSLKYLGLGALARQNEKDPQASAEEGAAGDEEPIPSRSRWTAVRRMTGTAPGESSRDNDDDDDDHNIRFTIGGVGRRMNKEDFIKEVQKLDSITRKEVAEQSTATRPIKEVAKRNPGLVAAATDRRRPSGVPRIVETRADSSERSKRSDESSSRGRPAVKEARPSPAAPSEDESHETPVERRRRLAVLSQQSQQSKDAAAGAQGDAGETPAERRRREAALGMGGGDADDSDSEDEGGERVPPARRGIRFAEPSRR
ncbi:Cation/H+ exchanger [Cordyceps fumosorosea ARSEF 2679]|uniref:Cation/H+ exchanger n=1 Tax=Cordyceps fumosorosea (strain ARSEF 2679) TaxID=1081104 RepID=A0A167Q4H5_CORFA|nr:Cation/H+ exchanger [Cordyceps fumosorosea ARSEF 2679]OAA57278.1 Cation/H+ exchanger [Cordyceps fumosorosea ARSEF 2679]